LKNKSFAFVNYLIYNKRISNVKSDCQNNTAIITKTIIQSFHTIVWTKTKRLSFEKWGLKKNQTVDPASA